MTTITTDKSAGREGLRLGNFIVGSVVLLLTMGSAHTVFGANTFWQGGGDVTDVDNWFKPLNWNAGVPTSADNAFINNGPNSGGSSTFSGSPPGTRINASGAVAFIMRVYNTSQLRVDGGDLTIGNILSLGETATSNTGTVYQTGGTVNINAMGIGGWFSPGIGFYNQSGGILNNPGGLYIGNPNTPAGSVGTFNLSGGTVNATGGTVVGGPSGTAVGTVVQSGSSILTTPYLQVYQNGGSATYTFNGGRLNLGNGFLANGSTFIVGDGTQSATLNDTAGVGGPTITFFDGLVIANNGTLMGNGAINANAAGVAINNGGHLAPGSSAGTLTPNILGLNGGSILDYELGPHDANGMGYVGGGTNDLTVVSTANGLTLDGILNVTPLDGFYDFGSGAAATNVYRLLNYTGTLTDNGLAIGSMPAGTRGFIDTSISGQVNLLVIPEPSVGLLALGGLLMMRRRRQ